MIRSVNSRLKYIRIIKIDMNTTKKIANFQEWLKTFTFVHIAISDVRSEISLQVLNIVLLQYQIIQLLILNVFTLTIPFHFLHFRHNIEFKYLHAQLLYTIFQGEYMTIHVTPEAGFSYVSFESNIPSSSYIDLVRRVIDTFLPGKFILTVFAHKVKQSTYVQKEIL